VLLGVSRTGKTPLSIYLAQKGYKVSASVLPPACQVTPGPLSFLKLGSTVLYCTVLPMHCT